jgi:hypothetical protein
MVARDTLGIFGHDDSLLEEGLDRILRRMEEQGDLGNAERERIRNEYRALLGRYTYLGGSVRDNS